MIWLWDWVQLSIYFTKAFFQMYFVALKHRWTCIFFLLRLGPPLTLCCLLCEFHSSTFNYIGNPDQTLSYKCTSNKWVSGNLYDPNSFLVYIQRKTVCGEDGRLDQLVDLISRTLPQNRGSQTDEMCHWNVWMLYL